MRRHSALERPIGFCSSTAFPASAAAHAISQCVSSGVAITTASTSRRSRTARQSVATSGIANRRATSPARSARARGDDAHRRAARGRQAAEVIVGDRAGAEEPDADRVGGRACRHAFHLPRTFTSEGSMRSSGSEYV